MKCYVQCTLNLQTAFFRVVPPVRSPSACPTLTQVEEGVFDFVALAQSALRGGPDWPQFFTQIDIYATMHLRTAEAPKLFNGSGGQHAMGQHHLEAALRKIFIAPPKLADIATPRTLHLWARRELKGMNEMRCEKFITFAIEAEIPAGSDVGGVGYLDYRVPVNETQGHVRHIQRVLGKVRPMQSSKPDVGHTLHPTDT